jgi:hypothetical protein
MNLRQALSLLRWSIQNRGLAKTFKAGLRRLSSHHAPYRDDSIHPFDRAYGVETGGLFSGGRLTAGSKNDLHNSGYYGIGPSRFNAGIERWKEYIPENALPTYSLIDLGSGKGRALMLASEHPFRRVIGTELNPGLASIAAENLRIWLRHNRSQCPIQILTQDVTAYNFPAGPCAVYIYNPFAAPVLQQVINNIERQFSDRSGLLDILYFKPEATELFDRHPRFTLLWSGTLPMSDEDSAADRVSSPDELCNIYRWGPAPMTKK